VHKHTYRLLDVLFLFDGCNSFDGGSIDTAFLEDSFLRRILLSTFSGSSFRSNHSFDGGNNIESGSGASANVGSASDTDAVADSNDNAVGFIFGDSINTDTNGDVWTLLLSFRSFNNNDSLGGGSNTERGTSIDSAFLDDSSLETRIFIIFFRLGGTYSGLFQSFDDGNDGDGA